ncbi:hypothetical protein LP419_15260 [Massilia sp. H-1]|nr:hypothetical protein LP419_15260 [Massilia sp. H-1]
MATVALHYAVLGWLGARIGAPQSYASQPAEAPIVAELIATPVLSPGACPRAAARRGQAGGVGVRPC